MKRTIALVVGFVLLTSLAFAGGVTDTNNGNLGDIFLSTGENRGANSIGTWTDITTIPELKGEQGEQGLPGASITGKDGYTPIKDVDYFDGKDGLNGVGLDGKNGKDGIGKQGLRGYTGKGLKNRQEAQLEIRIVDTKNTSLAIYGIYDFNNQISTVGAKCTIKIGKSYLEKKIEELERKIK